MDTRGIVAALAAVHGALGAGTATAPSRRETLPPTAPPIIYVINYSGEYFTKPEYIEQFKAAPPDLLHVGKAVPISHLWGPIRLYQGENQYTGGPGHTLSRENIALLTPRALGERVETIRRTLERYHAVGIREIVPYISYHTLAGDHEKRLGFWKFHDNWKAYEEWAGPRPQRDPFDWLVVDIKGKFVGGSCGGYSPGYYAPLHRYRACINHPDWAQWHRRLIRMVAQVGYDGCFIDNAHPDPCYCGHCKARFRGFLDEHRDTPWVRRLTEGLEIGKLALDSPDVPAELVRRWRVLRTGEHLGMLREAGRKVKPGFTIFPNSGRIDECLQVGDQCDRLMFESTYSPGLLAEDRPPATDEVCVDVLAGPAGTGRTMHRFWLDDPATFMEMTADPGAPGPKAAQAGKPAAFEVKVVRVGASLRDEDAAEDFHLLLGPADGGGQVRLDLEPRGAVGGSGSSRKPRQPPVVLKATWTPQRPGRYAVSFGFSYTGDSHAKDTRLRLHVARLSLGRVCRTHVPELLFTRHMNARAIYLGYEAARKGCQNVQELSLAEMAAFSGGGGFSGRGEPQAKYRAFFGEHRDLFDGWRPAAPAAVLFSYWGPNPLNTYSPYPAPTIHECLGKTHRLYVALVDKWLPDKPAASARTRGNPDGFGGFRVIYLVSPAYELTQGQLGVLQSYLAAGGGVVLADADVKINGRLAVQVLKAKAEAGNAAGLAVWDWGLADRMVRDEAARSTTPAQLGPWSGNVRTFPVAPSDGLRANLRFALYHKGGRIALHVVNYNVCLLDKAKRVLEVGPTPLSVPLPADWKAVKATCLGPDARPQALPCTVSGGSASVQLPGVRIYKVVLLEKSDPAPPAAEQ